MTDTLPASTIQVVDTTLRDGEQAPGVVFTTREKLDIAAALDTIGIDEIEAGIPAMGEAACRDIRAICKMKPGCIVTAWCRADARDIRLAAACNTPGVHISFPTSPVLLKTFGKSETWVIEQLDQLVTLGRKYFDHIFVGAQDAARTGEGFLQSFADAAVKTGADRLRLADTVGLFSPRDVMQLIQSLKQAVPGITLEFHGHNDLGMATANAVSAAQTGASAVSVTVNGLGERAGNAPLEEVVMALFRIPGVHTRVQTTGLSMLCRQVATFSGVHLSDAKPVTGKNVFRHESGIHCAGMLRNTDAYQLFDSETIGKNGFECVIGYHSGTAAVCHAFETHGITITPEKARSLLPVIRQTAMNQKSHLTPLQLQQIYAADRFDDR